MPKDDKCFICGRNRHAGRLEVHHIYGGARRSLSDRYGLTVTLCQGCHTQEPWSVHRNASVMLYLHQYGQRKAMEEHGWTTAEFAAVFGKNYLEE